jgi:hypothetical protein
MKSVPNPNAVIDRLSARLQVETLRTAMLEAHVDAITAQLVQLVELMGQVRVALDDGVPIGTLRPLVELLLGAVPK